VNALSGKLRLHFWHAYLTLSSFLGWQSKHFAKARESVLLHSFTIAASKAVRGNALLHSEQLNVTDLSRQCFGVVVLQVGQTARVERWR
jgi:hypothetical protein